MTVQVHPLHGLELHREKCEVQRWAHHALPRCASYAPEGSSPVFPADMYMTTLVGITPL